MIEIEDRKKQHIKKNGSEWHVTLPFDVIELNRYVFISPYYQL